MIMSGVVCLAALLVSPHCASAHDDDVGFGLPCNPRAVPPEHCPDGSVCPPNGQCDDPPAPRCFDVAVDHIIGEGDCGAPRLGHKCVGPHPAMAGARDAAECCDRCLATEHCECWTFKTNHEKALHPEERLAVSHLNTQTTDTTNLWQGKSTLERNATNTS